jgi:hypothetical protein
MPVGQHLQGEQMSDLMNEKLCELKQRGWTSEVRYNFWKSATRNGREMPTQETIDKVEKMFAKFMSATKQQTKGNK